MTTAKLSKKLPLVSVGIADLEALGRGASLLGSGGGGDPYVGRLMLENELASGKTLEIIELSQLSDDALVVPVCVMGAPTVMIEKFPNLETLALVLRVMEKRMGRRADALIPLEIGGLNSTIPLVLGARLGLPVVNADGMGRAFPEVQMVTYGIYGNDISPVIVANERGETVEIMSASNLQGERLGRAVVAEMGGAALVSLYPMTGRQVRETAIPGTLSLALELGRAITENKGQLAEDALFKVLRDQQEPRHGCVLFVGKVVDVRRETRGGFIVGSVSLERYGRSDDRLEVVFQNENLIAYRNDAVVATTPDIIALIDSETSEPITTEGLKYGQRVKVLGISAPKMMYTKEALAVVGPRAFRIDHDYHFMTEIAAELHSQEHV